MKKRIFLTCMFFLVLTGTAFSFNDGHSMITGIVKDISGETLVIDDITYAISPKCIVRIEYNVENAIYMKPARILDLRQGDSVNVVKLANTITEINIERWK